MQTAVTFKNLDSSENLKSYVCNKLDRFDRFLDNPAEASVVLAVEKFRHQAEINISGDRLNINIKEETDNMYSAIDMVLDKLEKQIKKNKQKIRERRSAFKGKAEKFESAANAPPDDEGVTKIRVKNIEFKPMDVEEAVMQMELVNKDFLVFTDARTDKVNVLYHCKDGHYGLIQPNR